MTLRHATAGDRDAVVALALHFHSATPYGQLLAVDAERVGALFDVALDYGVVLVAETPAAHVGFLALVALEHPLSGDRYAEEVAWWVEPAYRRGRLGPQLLAAGEAWARAEGCTLLKMIAPSGADSVAAFYTRQGYTPIETAWLKRVA